MGFFGQVNHKLASKKLQRQVRWLRQKVSRRDIQLHRLLAARLGICMDPAFIIIGTQKGGTTSLYAYLSEHPGVRGALTKEVHYFDRFYRRGWAWYKSNFPIQTKDDDAFITGEASPYYMFHASVPERIASVLPHVKLIALLRNPVDRAYSQYQHNRKLGLDDLGSFEDALERERAVFAAKGDSPRLYDNADYRYHSYVARGVYVEQLRRWLDVFPREQLLVLKSEAFYQDPATQFAAVLDFIGLPHWAPDQFEPHNPGSYAEKRIAPATLAALHDFYRPYNQQLGALLGMDFSAWDEY